ncbi:glycosyltransferase family 4 protein [Sinisalibacter aestuarii]|uniref:glycosyltransferase family 4 protein n=1 Tax=Sinisalibacter aestuarii TaxID=2949426 RepID=UPI00249197DB|nr:glycosyltransferase family 1 protein [Sinisalibacter aestuarii]
MHMYVHQGQINHIVGDVTYLALFLKRRNLYITIHDLNIFENSVGIKKFLIGMLWYQIPINRAQRISTVSDFTKEAIVSQFNISPCRVYVIPNPINSAFKFVEKRPISTRRTVNILQIGTKENKNIERCMVALNKLSDRYRLRLTVLGRLDHKRDLPSNGTLEIVNKWDLSLNDVAALYQESHLILFASTYEGFGMPILEAQAVGRPVVTSNLEPMRTVAGKGAFLVNPWSSADIARGIETLITNPQLADYLVESGLKNSKQYSLQKIAERYSAMYQANS